MSFLELTSYRTNTPIWIEASAIIALWSFDPAENADVADRGRATVVKFAGAAGTEWVRESPAEIIGLIQRSAFRPYGTPSASPASGPRVIGHRFGDADPAPSASLGASSAEPGGEP